MNQVTIFSIVILIAIFLLYRYVERRLNQIENRIAHKDVVPENNEAKNSLTAVEKKLSAIQNLCSPLFLLNIFDTWSSLTTDDSTQLELLVKDFEEAEETRVSKIKGVNDTEKEELQEYEEKHPNKKEFEPSHSLKCDILAASTAIVIRQTLHEQLEAVKELFFDVLNGKISIKEARQKSIKIASRKDIHDLENTLYSPELYANDIEKDKDIHPEIKKQFKEFFAMYQKRWGDNKWKDRLKWYKEMENYEN
ncbi:hypothetical protein HOG17_01975 [Candidatus Peregrinibacteria bacterium]|jgi:hypothetical protein|nr:hypothetical protein [Candidatus Peregrinibacteria bacterium]MBT4148491.1 hypothetical protein [Candidatus Peregrinibacteria bacterium]MBT4456419.1 hypothetical protein [Candidatus Peregrinibacteria bacterium]